MGLTPQELGDRLTSKEIEELKALNAIDPVLLGDRLDRMAAHICACLANIHCRAKGAPEYTWQQFMPQHDRQPEAPRRKTAQELFVMARTLNEMFGGLTVTTRLT